MEACPEIRGPCPRGCSSARSPSPPSTRRDSRSSAGHRIPPKGTPRLPGFASGSPCSVAPGRWSRRSSSCRPPGSRRTRASPRALLPGNGSLRGTAFRTRRPGRKPRAGRSFYPARARSASDGPRSGPSHDEGHWPGLFRMKWTLPRCQEAPSHSFRTAAWRPAWASEMHSAVLIMPRALSLRKNARQLSSDSSNMGSTAKISREPAGLTPQAIITATETTRPSTPGPSDTGHRSRGTDTSRPRVGSENRRPGCRAPC